MPKLYDVAIYPPGDSFNRIVVPAMEYDTAESAAQAAVGTAIDTINALAKHAHSTWRVHVVRETEMSDIEE